ncbi:MAG: hypothetical protein ACXWPS_01475 [Ktedonobacteraceae bacterium]
MHFSSRSKLSVAISLAALVVVVTGLMATGALRGVTTKANAASATAARMNIKCAAGAITCTEVWDTAAVFGPKNPYVGHDEPSTLFYSNTPGSGNQMSYRLTLPQDPSPANPNTLGKSYNFELHPAFWFGMAMCDTQSFPELVSGCKPDSDTNIVDPAISPKHPGTAFMEMQFYPPGWVPWPAGNSCDATKWCAALNIDSLSENPVTGQVNNATCLSTVGIEPVNFAFLTLNGKSQAPANPVDATVATYTPDPTKDLFMNSGDKLTVTMHDTAYGLQIVVNDLTTGQSGSMTSSKGNGFGQVKFDPTGTTCTNIPYNFHPMYSTSSEKTRVTWAAHSYNIAFADETGHFDMCNDVHLGVCIGNEGIKNDNEPADADDVGCFQSSQSTLVKIKGCIGTNTGFDGVPYQPVWPDGNTQLHPTPIMFSSPLTGAGYNVNYSRIAFEADLPRIEVAQPGGSSYVCDRSTGDGCTLIPNTDDGLPAAFYPFFSIRSVGGQCVWQIGNHIPGSKNDFGQNAQYGTLLNLTYTTVGGGPTTRYNDFRFVLSKNPCNA